MVAEMTTGLQYSHTCSLGSCSIFASWVAAWTIEFTSEKFLSNSALDTDQDWPGGKARRHSAT